MTARVGGDGGVTKNRNRGIVYLRFRRIFSRIGIPLGCCLGFVVLACIFMNYAGLQQDEVLFAGPLCRSWRFFAIPFRHHEIPLMNMSYNGALKTWIYSGLLAVAHKPSPALVRMPMVLAGAATIALFWGLLSQLYGFRAALAGCVLLSSDTSFLLTTTYDWGPVALQHFLIVAAMYWAFRWHKEGRRRFLALGAFCCGLALWDKAVSVWVLSGLAVGLILVMPKIWQRCTVRDAALALGALCFGSLPLIVYNLASVPKFATFRSNTNLASDVGWAEYKRKFPILRAALDGSALFGYVVNDDAAPQPRLPQTGLERISFSIRHRAGEHRRNRMPAAYLAAFLLLPILWRTPARRWLLFCGTAILVTWLFMATTGGGGSAQHAVLLWPLPQLFLAVALSEVSLHLRFGRVLLGVVLLFLTIGNLLTTNQYLYQFVRDGAAVTWTDAIYGLADGVRRSGATEVLLPDWGATDQLCVLNGDHPTTRLVDDSALRGNGSQKGQTIFGEHNAVWVEHVSGLESSPGLDDKITNAAHQAGYAKTGLETYRDTNGRAIFEMFRLTPLGKSM